jgi:hypothetical protein
VSKPGSCNCTKVAEVLAVAVVLVGSDPTPEIQLVSFRYRKRCGSSLEIPSRSLRCSS